MKPLKTIDEILICLQLSMNRNSIFKQGSKEYTQVIKGQTESPDVIQAKAELYNLIASKSVLYTQGAFQKDEQVQAIPLSELNKLFNPEGGK